MAKYYGVIGYSIDEVETKPSIWENLIEERTVYGDVIKNFKKTENPGQANDNINVNIQISFIADVFAMEHFHNIKYATYMGKKWSVTSVEPNYPRLIIDLGGLYNDK